MEPLTTVSDLKKHLLKVVAKQWYDYERNTFKFIEHFKEGKEAISFNYESDFDANGIVYWMGTNARSTNEWVNPAQYGLMVIVSSEGRNLPYGKPEDILNRDAAALNCHTNDDKNSWFVIDTGLWVTPTAYTLRHARGYGRSALRNWTFQGSKEGQTWTTLFTHTNDSSLNEPGSTATWVIDAPSTSDDAESWRMFRIQQTGPNASGQTHYLSLSGFEIYGTVSGATDDPPGSLLTESETNSRKQRRVFRSQVLRQMALNGSKEGADLKLLKERARQLGEAVDGIKSETKNEGWVDVSWMQSAAANAQGENAQDHANVKVVDISDPDVQTAITQAEKKDIASSKQGDSSATEQTKGSNSSGKKRILQSNTGNSEDTQIVGKITGENHSSSREISADLANLRLLMAVEDLLDNASSDLVASALAEARNLDQLRASARSLMSPFLSGGRNRPLTSAQGSAESSSHPNQHLDKKDIPSAWRGDSPLPIALIERFDVINDDDSTVKDADIAGQESTSDSESTSKANTDTLFSTDDQPEKWLLSPLDSESIQQQDANQVSGKELIAGGDDKGNQNDHSSVDSSVTELVFGDDSKQESVVDVMSSSDISSSETQRSELVTVEESASQEAEKSAPASKDDVLELGISGVKDATKTGENADSVELDNDDRYVTTFFDARTDEVSESDKNRQNNRTRDVPMDDGEMLFNKNTQVELTVPRPDNRRGDSLEKTPEGLTLLEAIELKFAYDSSEDEDDDADDDDEKDTDGPIIDKKSLRIYSDSGKPRKVTKRIEKEPLLTDYKQKEGSKSVVEDSAEKGKETPTKDEAKPLIPPLRTCSLMVDMDEDYMEDYPMDEGDDTDEFEDIENEDENDPDDLYERTLNVNPPSSSTDRPAEMRRRLWDDDFVLKRQFSALIPAFDPRPGRTNVSQHQDVVIPEEGELIIQEEVKGEELMLMIRGTTAAGKEVEIELDDSEASVFSYIQKLTTNMSSGGGKLDKQRRVWEPTYTVVYKSPDASGQSLGHSSVKWDALFVEKYLGTNKLPKSDVVRYLQQNADTEFIRKWRLTGSAKSCRKQRNCSQLRNAYRDFCRQREIESRSTEDKSLIENANIEVDLKDDYPDVFAHVPSEIAPAKEVLDLVRSLHKLCEENNQITSLTDDYLFDVPEEEFISLKLTNKLVQQIQDPLVLASGALPAWCEFLVINYPSLFPFETRKMYFQATAFGCSRSIVWLQSLHDANLERSRGHSARRLEPQEIRIGRMKHERVKVPRNDKELLQYAIRLLDFHAGRKAILEIEFKDEEGTGLGPSLEFYALVAKELQKKELGMWVADDNLHDVEKEDEDSTLNTFVHHHNGLFPAPYPQDDKDIDRICKLFHFLGIFLAKCLQDNRLVDIPLSEPFHKLLCLGRIPSNRGLSRSPSVRSDCESLSPRSSDSMDYSSETCCCCSDLFSECDFEMIYPYMFKFTKQLRKLVEKRKAFINDMNISDELRAEKLSNLFFETENGHECKLEDLGLNFQYISPSKSYGFDSVNLKPNGEHEALIASNAEEYIDLMMNFTMYKGIEKQLDSFRAGFSRVFPMEKLHAFSPREIQLILSGEQAPKWTREDLMNYTEPKFGYTKESPGFLRLINVLVNMNGHERKSFLQFATGCSSLPPGGIANLHPRLTVVKKESEGDGSFPSVNTCVHYLKLPEYSSEEILRNKLLAATKEKGFHLN